MTVEPTGMDNVSSSAILNLWNVNTNLPPPLLPNPGSHRNQHQQVHQMEVTNPGQVTNSEILKSIQSITEVMQQQLLLNSKTTKQGIVQMASLFQEMIKAQEKKRLGSCTTRDTHIFGRSQRQTTMFGLGVES